MDNLDIQENKDYQIIENDKIDEVTNNIQDQYFLLPLKDRINLKKNDSN